MCTVRFFTVLYVYTVESNENDRRLFHIWTFCVVVNCKMRRCGPASFRKLGRNKARPSRLERGAQFARKLVAVAHRDSLHAIPAGKRDPIDLRAAEVRRVLARLVASTAFDLLQSQLYLRPLAAHLTRGRTTGRRWWRAP